MGDCFLRKMHKYRTNVDIVTMVLAWGLKLGEKEDVIVWVLRGYVEGSWL